MEQHVNPSIFHLSLPARDLEETRDFYCSVLGAVPGRATPQWIDLILFGHQVTFHQRPEQVMPPDAQRVQHFGAIVAWQEWEVLCAAVAASGHPTLVQPTIVGHGTQAEHGKLLLRDPSGHVLEFKTYRNLATVLPGHGQPVSPAGHDPTLRNQEGGRLSINFATTFEDIRACFEVVAELRPHLSLQEYAESVGRMTSSAGYKLAYLRTDDIKVVAGIRISEWLHSGRYLEIEDLVTRSGERSQGHGSAMFHWIKRYAIEHGCKQLRLVSGISRIGAHRFYERHGMVCEAKYFSLQLR